MIVYGYFRQHCRVDRRTGDERPWPYNHFGLGAGIEAEEPVRLSIRSVLFILLAYFSNGIVDTVLKIGGTPYHWIMDSDLSALSFADFNSVMLAIIGVCANGAVAPDVRRAGVSSAHERLMPAAAHKHGRGVHHNPALTVRKTERNDNKPCKNIKRYLPRPF